MNERLAPDQHVPLLRGLLAPFPDLVLQRICDQIDDQGAGHLPPAGEHAAATPVVSGPGGIDRRCGPRHHAASGLGCLHRHRRRPVIADELANADSIEGGLRAFEARRWERCRMVVENSGRLGEIEIANGDKDEHGG